LQTCAQTGKFEAEGLRVRKDGSLFWCSVVIDPIRDDAGALIGSGSTRGSLRPGTGTRSTVAVSSSDIAGNLATGG